MKFRLPALVSGSPVVEETTAPHDAENPAITGENKETAVNNNEKGNDSGDDSSEHHIQQHGVEAIRAMTTVWTRQHLIIAYILIWLVSFVQAFSSGIIGTLTPYVTSSFQEHSLTATTSIVAGIVSGVIKLPFAKIMNVWGRPQAFGFMVLIMTIGIIMLAGCNNVTTYAAGQVFYSVGYSCIDFSSTIFIADTSQLKSRAFMIAFASSPWLATVWAYGPAAQDALDRIGFRWGLGVWAIIYPVVCLPLFGLFYWNQRKAVKQGLVKTEEHGRSFTENTLFWLKEFDVIGILLVVAGLSLFLLAFAIYTYQKDEWKSPLIICFLIFGGLLVIAFAVWEKYFAPVTFIPWNLIANRTVFFTYTMVASIYTAWYVWDNYLYSMLIVVYNQTVAHATYIGNIYTMGATFIAIVMGIVIRFNGRLKWLALYIGVPLTILGVGLMIHFRQPDQPVGYICMCLIFIAFGGGTLVVCEQMTVMAVSRHEDITAVLAMEGMVANVGGSIGSTIAAAMWTSIFPKKLMEYLPASAVDNFANIYGDLTVQASYPIGSPARDAINHAYGDTQRLMLITAVCMYSITLASVLMWKDINVKNIKQVKGMVW